MWQMVASPQSNVFVAWLGGHHQLSKEDINEKIVDYYAVVC